MYSRNPIYSKIQALQEAQHQVNEWRKEADKTIVFTNGCFDLIHKGHLDYLMEAKALADYLIVGINSNASVERLKGITRPIKDEQSRVLLIASLQFVDLVVVFEEDTPILLIEGLLPDVLVKGGDWKPHQIVGSDVVLKHGGEVISLSFLDGYSTTNYVNKIKKENPDQ